MGKNALRREERDDACVRNYRVAFRDLKRDKMSAKAAGRAKVRRVQILFFHCKRVSLSFFSLGRGDLRDAKSAHVDHNPSLSRARIHPASQLDAYRKKKAAKKSAQSTSGNDAKDAKLQATKPPIGGGEGEEKEGDLSAPSTTTEGEENGTTFAFTMAPDAVRYNGKEGGEDIAHATPIKPADLEQEHRIEEEEEGVAAFTSPPPPQFSFDDGYNVRRSTEEESTPPVKINLQSFEENEEEEDGDINRKKKVSSLDESFDPEEYITQFVTLEKKTAPSSEAEKATIDVPMDELEAIFRPTKNKGDYDDDYVPHSFSRFLEKEKNKTDEGANLHAHEKQRLSSFEREILESKRRKEQMGGESSISDTVNRSATLPIFGGSNAARISRLEQDEIMSLQNMIDDLTTEKLSLKRGMDKNQKIIESLMEENESLTNAFNEAKNTNAVLENQLKKLSSEMMLHSSVQQSISNDRDASRRGYIQTRERANELA